MARRGCLSHQINHDLIRLYLGIVKCAHSARLALRGWSFGHPETFAKVAGRHRIGHGSLGGFQLQSPTIHALHRAKLATLLAFNRLILVERKILDGQWTISLQESVRIVGATDQVLIDLLSELVYRGRLHLLYAILVLAETPLLDSE